LSDEPPCSDREKRAQLRGDAEDRAGDDADNGGEEAADNRKTKKSTHDNTSLSGAPVVEVLVVPATATYNSRPKLANNFEIPIQGIAKLEKDIVYRSRILEL
jgi:hypothetical protein